MGGYNKIKSLILSLELVFTLIDLHSKDLLIAIAIVQSFLDQLFAPFFGLSINF